MTVRVKMCTAEVIRYECSDEEPIPVSEKHPLPFHLEDCPGQPNVSKPLPEQAQHVGHDDFFYEDPVFDQQVIAELEHPTMTVQETPYFQAGGSTRVCSETKTSHAH